jgi:hypothetical protein
LILSQELSTLPIVVGDMIHHGDAVEACYICYLFNYTSLETIVMDLDDIISRIKKRSEEDSSSYTSIMPEFFLKFFQGPKGSKTRTWSPHLTWFVMYVMIYPLF